LEEKGDQILLIVLLLLDIGDVGLYEDSWVSVQKRWIRLKVVPFLVGRQQSFYLASIVLGLPPCSSEKINILAGIPITDFLWTEKL
jgi:hypothetical protein